VIFLISFNVSCLKGKDLVKRLEYVLIEHVGVTSKAIASIVISRKGIVKESNRVFYFTTNKKDYADLKQLIHKCKGDGNADSKLGTFRI